MLTLDVRINIYVQVYIKSKTSWVMQVYTDGCMNVLKGLPKITPGMNGVLGWRENRGDHQYRPRTACLTW